MRTVPAYLMPALLTDNDSQEKRHTILLTIYNTTKEEKQARKLPGLFFIG